jgi:DNA-binding GntR family transcriptional regulator
MTMTPFRFSEKRGVSLRHQISDDIRQAIFEGKLKPGDRIREMDISKQMGVSRGPIREAMRVLELEGLLFSQPYKETVVAEFTKEEAIEVLIPIRLVIELFAIRKGVPLMSDQDLDHLSEIVNGMQLAADREDLLKLVDLDLSFHEYLVRMSKYDHVIGIWSSISSRIRLHFLFQGKMYEDLQEVWKEHIILLETLKQKNIAKLEQEMTQHISVSNLLQLSRDEEKDKA